MLILTRKPGESLYIGDVKVTIVELKGHQIRIGIAAPPEVRIYREEIYLQILDENRKAAEASNIETGLAGLGDLAGLGESWKGRGEYKGDKDSSKEGNKTKLPALSPLSSSGSSSSAVAKQTEPKVFKRKKVRSSHDSE